MCDGDGDGDGTPTPPNSGNPYIYIRGGYVFTVTTDSLSLLPLFHKGFRCDTFEPAP